MSAGPGRAGPGRGAGVCAVAALAGAAAGRGGRRGAGAGAARRAGGRARARARLPARVPGGDHAAPLRHRRWRGRQCARALRPLPPPHAARGALFLARSYTLLGQHNFGCAGRAATWCFRQFSMSSEPTCSRLSGGSPICTCGRTRSDGQHAVHNKSITKADGMRVPDLSRRCIVRSQPHGHALALEGFAVHFCCACACWRAHATAGAEAGGPLGALAARLLAAHLEGRLVAQLLANLGGAAPGADAAPGTQGAPRRGDCLAAARMRGRPAPGAGRPELGARRRQAHAQLAPGFAGCSCETGMLEVPCPIAAS